MLGVDVACLVDSRTPYVCIVLLLAPQPLSSCRLFPRDPLMSLRVCVLASIYLLWRDIQLPLLSRLCVMTLTSPHPIDL
jgi:hypothetical protein